VKQMSNKRLREFREKLRRVYDIQNYEVEERASDILIKADVMICTPTLRAIVELASSLRLGCFVSFKRKALVIYG